MPSAATPLVEGSLGNTSLAASTAPLSAGLHGSPDAARQGETIITTSLTVEYAEGWGIERIALDSIQNHLPSDSKGRNIVIDFFVDGAWVPLRAARSLNPSQVGAIMIGDDGVGFPYENLELLFSSKKNDEASVGQFGEGLKMLTAACLRLGMRLQVFSRDWMAEPFVRDRRVGTRDARQVCYRVAASPVPLRGSATCIWEPLPEFTQYLQGIDSKILPLRRGFRPLFSSPYGSIVDHSGSLFVKGVHVSDSLRKRLIFGYNLPTELNRDRNAVDPNLLNNAVGSILRELNDEALIADLLRAAKEHHEAREDKVEFDAVYWHRESSGYHARDPRYYAAWKRAFHAVFGQNAILPSNWHGSAKADPEADRLAQNMGFQVVKLPDGIVNALAKSGVPLSTDVTRDDDMRLLKGEDYDPGNVTRRLVESGITLDYRSEKQSTRRLFLELLANHMPGDSGATALPEIFVEVPRPHYHAEFEWVPLEERSPGTTISGIRIRDDGNGYDSARLGVLHSGKKNQSAAVGQFGEGLSLSSATAVRLQSEHPSFYLTLRSRDWAAMPIAKPHQIDGEKTDKLAFHLAVGLNAMDGSQTTIHAPTPEMQELLGQLGSHVLAFSDSHRTLYRSRGGAIIDGENSPLNQYIPKGTLFVKGFRVTSALSDQLLFSYDLYTRIISPDRDQIDLPTAKKEVRDLIAHCADETVIETILEAGKDNERDFVEFAPIEFDASNAALKEIYKRIFHRLYGDRAVLATREPYTFAEAKHQNYDPITLPLGLTVTLQACGVLTDRECIREGFVPRIVNHSQLTAQEKAMLALYVSINRHLGLEDRGPPEIFDQLHLRNGRPNSGVLGYFDPNAGKVLMRRDQLKHIGDFVETYVHEMGHAETGANDPEDAFRNFFEHLLGDYVTAEVQGKPRVASTSVQRRTRADLREEVRKLTAQLEKQATQLQEKTAALQEEQARARQAATKLARAEDLIAENQRLKSALADQPSWVAPPTRLPPVAPPPAPLPDLEKENLRRQLQAKQDKIDELEATLFSRQVQETWWQGLVNLFRRKP